MRIAIPLLLLCAVPAPAQSPDPIDAVLTLPAATDAEGFYRTAQAWQKLGSYALGRLRTSGAASARLHQFEGEAKARGGNPRGAIEEYRKAVVAGPHLRGTHLALAVLYWRTGKKEEALAEIEAELLIAPASVAALGLKQQLEGK